MASAENITKSLTALVAGQAETWFARLMSPECTDEERNRFHVWLKTTPAHANAFAEVEQTWTLLSELRLDSDVQVAAEEALRETRRHAHLRFSSAQKWGVSAALAATILATVAILWPTSAPRNGNVETTQRFSTRADEQRSITLADGSTVHLDVDTQLQVQYSPSERNVELVNGRAIFEVNHKDHIPFVVHAANGLITDVGTRFEVERVNDRVSIVLLSGEVTVTEGEPSSLHRLQKLSPGQRLQYSNDPDAWSLRSVDADVETSWSRGQLIFRATSLVEVVSKVNRYAVRKIRLGDPALDALKLSGSFNSGDSDSVALAIQSMLPISVTHPSPNDILLIPRDPRLPRN